MSNKLKATPKYILEGVDDQSGGTLPVIPEEIPTHLPHVFAFTERGPSAPQIVVGSTLTRLYGAKSFDYREKYANHQTVLINTLNGNGNAVVMHRLKPADAAPPATLCLYLDIVAEPALPNYDRNADGTYALDVNGDPIIDTVTPTIAGYLAKWVVGPMTGAALGQAASTAGTLVASNLAVSTMYPIHELELSSFGAYGNNVGIRFWAPTTTTTPSIKEDVVVDQNTMLYRMQMIERPDANSQPNIVKTIAGSQSIEFSYKEGAINTAVDQDLFVDNVLLNAYQDLNFRPIVPGPFGAMYVYHNHIKTILEMIFATEQPHQAAWPTTAATGAHLVNFVSAKTPTGIPYYTLKINTTDVDASILSSTSNHYATGGSDGNMTFTTFDTLVKNQCANYGDLEYTFLDDAKYPQAIIYDTGYTLETKKALLVPMGRRKDMAVILSTQDVSQPQNTAEQEAAMATALRAAARMYPESEVYGTPVCRAAVIGHSGYLINSQYKGLLPLTIDVANKASKFMGAGNGIWKRDRGFDMAPYNQVTMFKSDSVNCTYKSAPAYDADWDNGLTWVQNFDTRSLFFPAFQTVYDDSTSVVNSLINMFIIVEIEKVCQRAWRQLTGGAKLTKAQFIEKSNALIDRMTDKRFDDRVLIKVDTYFDDYDEVLGYSWSTNITLGLNNMVSVGSFKITTKRRSDFAE